jgi:hypothetical protein
MTAPTKRERAIWAARDVLEHKGNIDAEDIENVIAAFESAMEKDESFYLPPYQEGKDCHLHATRDNSGVAEIFLRHPNPRFTDCARYLTPEEQTKLGEWLLRHAG